MAIMYNLMVCPVKTEKCVWYKQWAIYIICCQINGMVIQGEHLQIEKCWSITQKDTLATSYHSSISNITSLWGTHNCSIESRLSEGVWWVIDVSYLTFYTFHWVRDYITISTGPATWDWCWGMLWQWYSQQRLAASTCHQPLVFLWTCQYGIPNICNT